MLIARNGKTPRIDDGAAVAASACIVGDVTIGSKCYIDHHVLLESAGPPITIGARAIVFAGSVIRSVGGASRPAFGVEIGSDTLVAPHCTLAGCRIGPRCYIATAAIVLQGASVGEGSRVGVSAIVHASTVLPPRTRIGMRHMAVATADGFISTADVEAARRALGSEAFFRAAFDLEALDPATLHEQVIAKLLDEVHGWHDATLP